MRSFSDPDCLRDRGDIPVQQETQRLSTDEFESVVEHVESHAAIGVTSDEGAVLLMSDGSHGWTLPAFSVEQGQNWPERTQQEAEALFKTPITLEEIEQVRCVEFRAESNATKRSLMYNVIFRASMETTVDVDSTTDTDAPSLGWFDTVPDQQQEELAEDIRLFVSTE